MSDSDSSYSEADTTEPKLEPCSNCGRTFRPDVLKKHIPICTKQKQRKTFDMQKIRTNEMEVKPSSTTLKEIKALKNKDESNGRASESKPHWKIKSEQFRSTLRNARLGKDPPPPTINPDYVQCEYCSRRFSKEAAERHIPFCKEKASRIATSAPKSKLKQYVPPTPKNVKSASKPSRESTNTSNFGGTSRTNGATMAATTPPGSGKALRTGRTPASYAEARTLSGDQKKRAGTNYNPQKYSASPNVSKFCSNCGGAYPVPQAKFCCECGVKRLSMTR